jgi:beta-glucanase (GH16 family)
MKKIHIFILAFLSLIMLSSCTIPIGLSFIGNLPEISGLTTIETVIGSRVELLEGVFALDKEDGDVTQNIEIINLSELPILNNQFSFDGTYKIKYQVTDSDGNKVVYFRNLIIYLTSLNCINPYNDMTLTFCDDFENPSRPNSQGIDLDNWTFQIGDGTQYGIPGWGNNEAQFYKEENSFVEDSFLHIEAKLEATQGYQYTSSRLITKDNFSQMYGRFEARIALPLGDGLWPAFWMLPENSPYGGWAASGEIDIMEARGRLPYEASAAIHFGGQWPDNKYVSETYRFPNNIRIDQFNTYAVEWREDRITWFYNDIKFYEVTEWYSTNGPFPAPFNTDFHMILNLAIGGNFDGGRLPNSSIFSNPVYMKVDYVRVFSFNE